RVVERSELLDTPAHLGEGKYYELQFTDNGIGFDQQYHQQIFSIFQRLHNGQAYVGTGVGLALCKKIVENHKGHITARSEPGKGATFYVYLPV
ncbi:MAG TPA: ATP-binding protein, partial [Cyclobacteriaceae bacterium]|nr:ATP-binding protein [Cyclobacteriaceae bacterium]